jgi:hypothetical protein
MSATLCPRASSVRCPHATVMRSSRYVRLPIESLLPPENVSLGADGAGVVREAQSAPRKRERADASGNVNVDAVEIALVPQGSRHLAAH